MSFIFPLETGVNKFTDHIKFFKTEKELMIKSAGDTFPNQLPRWTSPTTSNSGLTKRTR